MQLTVNCRNTRRINELVMRYYKGGTIEAPGPEGPPIDRHVYELDRRHWNQEQLIHDRPSA